MNTTIRARSSKSPSGPWQEIALPVPPGDLANPSTYVHENGTVTMIVHTCAVEPPGGWLNPTSIKCFSILRAPHWSGPWRTIAQNFLDVPLHCSRNRTDPAYQCACHIEVRRHPRALPAALALTGCSESDSGCLCNTQDPTIWFDKPMNRWRVLMHQYPSVIKNGTCASTPDHYKYVGGCKSTSVIFFTKTHPSR